MTISAMVVPPAAMLIALGIDQRFGEPPASVHPVVLMGRLLACSGDRLLTFRPAAAFLAGAVAWTGIAVLTFAAIWYLERLVAAHFDGYQPWLRTSIGALAFGLLLKPMFAWRLLRDEVRNVERSLLVSLAAGRTQVARIAGRDTTELDAVQVRETAIESLAENLNDSVVAPLFWFAVAGLPGAVLYRFANTADAMWGKRGDWEWAGKWAARADDVLSFIPARLTAMVMIPPARWGALKVEAGRTESPNGGWPMGAAALRLGIRLGRPGFYVLNAGGQTASPDDVERAIQIASAALYMVVPILMAVSALCATSG